MFGNHGFHVLSCIGHSHSQSCRLQHAQVIQAVSKGHCIPDGKSQVLRCKAQCNPLGRPQGIHFQEVRLGAGYLCPAVQQLVRLCQHAGNLLRLIHHQHLGGRPVNEPGQVPGVFSRQHGGCGVLIRIHALMGIIEFLIIINLTVGVMPLSKGGHLPCQQRIDGFPVHQDMIRRPYFRSVAGNVAGNAAHLFHEGLHAVPRPAAGRNHSNPLLRCSPQYPQGIGGYGSVVPQKRIIHIKCHCPNHSIHLPT